jgi:hypothetical protein
LIYIWMYSPFINLLLNLIMYLLIHPFTFPIFSYYSRADEAMYISWEECGWKKCIIPGH